MSRGGWFWKVAWNYYDSDWGAWLPHKIVPWLFGMYVGSKGRRAS